MADQPSRDPVLELLDSAQRETQDLMSALCQVHTDRVADLLGRDMHAQMAQVIAQRFAQLELSLRPRMARARLEVARGLAQVLNECFTRMRRFEGDRQWCEAMMDAAGAMCRRCAFFSVRGDNLCLQSARGMDNKNALPPSEIPYGVAPAFERVITTSRTHTVTRSAAELSLPIAAMFGSDGGGRALLVPVSTGDRVPGVIYAEEAVEASAIELVAMMAGAVLEKHLRLFEPVRSTGGPVRSVRTSGGTAPPPEPSGEMELAASAPPAAQDPAQLEARRFAMVEVARLMLAKVDDISNGRRERALYRKLRGDIDPLRAKYLAQFTGPRDYLHAEIVRTLALNDVALLGREYPGPVF